MRAGTKNAEDYYMKNLAKVEREPVALTVVQVRKTFQEVVRVIHEAQGLPQIEAIRDTQAQMKAFLETRAAARAMGDDIEQLRTELRCIARLADIRQGEITAGLAPAKKKEVLQTHGIALHSASMCERAARIERQRRGPVLELLRSTPKEITTQNLARIGDLSPARQAVVERELPTCKNQFRVDEAIERSYVVLPPDPTQKTPKQQDASKRVMADYELARAKAAGTARNVQALASRLVMLTGRLAQGDCARDKVKSIVEEWHSALREIDDECGISKTQMLHVASFAESR